MVGSKKDLKIDGFYFTQGICNKVSTGQFKLCYRPPVFEITCFDELIFKFLGLYNGVKLDKQVIITTTMGFTQTGSVDDNQSTLLPNPESQM